MKNNGRFRKKLNALFGGMYVMWAVMSGSGILNSVAEVQAADVKAMAQNIDKSVVSDITIDGDLSEWSAMDSFEVSESGLSEWKMTMSEDKSMLYFCFGGTAVSEWDQNYICKLFTIKYDNGTNLYCQINNLSTGWILPGAEVKMYSNAHGTNPGNYGVECALPVNEGAFSITFAGTTVSSANIPEFVKTEVKEPVYEGIVIDGDYDDWDAIAKTDAECPNKDHSWECLSSTACIMDGDYIYIYIKDGATGSAAGAGLYSNGRYSIVTDLGRTLTFQLSSANGGTINGIDGATAAYFGNEWEAAIPVSALPQWNNSISFGLYQSEPFVSGVMDLNNENSGIVSSNGIVYDGLYGDWDTYPHTLIQYATAGTQTNDPDGEGALCHDGSIVFGHVVSSMEAHLAEKGGEFSSAISICFNGEREYNGDKTWNFYPRLVAVANDGTINWSPATQDLDEGNYEFYLADARGEYNTNTLTNIADLAEHEKFFGRMTITVKETINETEFYVDLEQVAKFLSYYSDTKVEAGDFKLVEAQFGRIGNEFISTAGASAGPYVGVALCMAVSAAVLIKRRHNKVVK